MSRPPALGGLSRALAPVPAPALFVTSGLSMYLGAAVAVGLFALMPPHTVAWLRAVVSALVLVALTRPWRASWTRTTFLQSALFGIVLVGMNMLFYIAIRHLPLGAAVAIEFAGPALVAAWGNRTGRGRAAVTLAVLGVASISLLGLEWDVDGGAGGLLIGLACAATAGAAWAWYMVLAGRIAAVRDGQTSLALGSAVAVVVLAPIAMPFAGPLLTASAGVWLAALGVGVLSSTIPYILDQIAISRLGTATFALLTALLPATATVVGLLALQQRPTFGEVLGLTAISLAVALTPAARPVRRTGLGEPS